MARISKSDRDQATDIVKRKLTKWVEILEDHHRADMEALRKEAEKRVDRRFSFTKRMDRVDKLRSQARDIEENLLEEMGPCKQNGWRTPGLHDKFKHQCDLEYENLLGETDYGADMKTIKQRIEQAKDRIFLATSHNDLVSIIEELISL